jgi:hypothetical protein
MRTFLLIGCLILYSLHWSCSKSSDNFNISYNSIYHKTGVGPSTGLRLFTSKGEIKDPEILKQYNTSDNNLFLFYSGNFVQSSDFMDSIEFTDSRHARLYHNNQWIKNEVANQSTIFILSRVDTTTNSIAGDPYSESLEYAICQYKPEIFQEWLISSTRGNYVFGYTNREKYVFDLSGNFVSAYMTIYIRHQPFNTTTEFVNNYMDEKFYQTISQNDTLSVQSYYLRYEE